MGFNSKVVIGSIVMTICLIPFTVLLFSLGTSYNIQIDEGYEDIFDNYALNNQVFDEQNEIIEGGTINPDGQDQAVFKNVIVAGKNLRSSGNLLIRTVGNFFNLGNFLPEMFLAILVLIMTLTILGFIAFISGGNTP